MPARTPEDCDRLFQEALNAGNLEALVALYEPNATLVAAPGQNATGTDAIRQALAGFVAAKPKIDLQVENTLRAGDDLAVCYGKWTLTAATPDGGATLMSGKSVEVVRRQADGTWRFAIDDPFGRGA